MDVNDSLKQIIEKISGTLNFFDFTFLVSGTVTSAIIYFSLTNFISYPTFTNSIVKCFAIIVFIYVCGLVSFAAGKKIRLIMLSSLKNEESFNDTFSTCISKFNELSSYDETKIIPYEISRDRKLESYVYKKMWVDIRHHAKGIDTVIYLNRFVMMQAICEGLMFSSILLILWGIETIIILSDSLTQENKIILILVSVILSVSTAYISRHCFDGAKLFLKQEFKKIFSRDFFKILKSKHLTQFASIILFIISFIYWIIATKNIIFTPISFVPLGIFCAKAFSLEAQRSAETQICELTIAYKKFIINNN